MLCGIFNSIPRLYPPDANSSPPPSRETSKNVFGSCRCFWLQGKWGHKRTPSWELQLYNNDFFHLCQGAFAGQFMEFGKTSKDVVITVSTLSDVMETGDGNFSPPMTTHTPWKLFTSFLFSYNTTSVHEAHCTGIIHLLVFSCGFCEDRAPSYPQLNAWSPAECPENSTFSIKIYWLID